MNAGFTQFHKVFFIFPVRKYELWKVFRETVAVLSRQKKVQQ